MLPSIAPRLLLPMPSIMAEPAQIGLAFGSNIGDARANILKAISEVEQRGIAQIVKMSSVWRTPPWGPVVQAPFANACAIAATQLRPLGLLDVLKTLERDLGRTESERWGPRVIDIDILFYEALVLNDARLVLPHPSMLERAFVLAPLAEIAPNLTIGGQNIADALQRVDQDGLSLWSAG